MDFHVVPSVFVFNNATAMLIKSQYKRYPQGATLETLTVKKGDAVFKIIDTVLKQVFGEEATSFIYKYLEQHYSLHQSEFSKKIDVFAKGLEECLSAGAFAVESKILEDISAIYGTVSEARFERTLEGYDFATQMKIAMRRA